MTTHVPLMQMGSGRGGGAPHSDSGEGEMVGAGVDFGIVAGGIPSKIGQSMMRTINIKNTM